MIGQNTWQVENKGKTHRTGNHLSLEAVARSPKSCINQRLEANGTIGMEYCSDIW